MLALKAYATTLGWVSRFVISNVVLYLFCSESHYLRVWLRKRAFFLGALHTLAVQLQRRGRKVSVTGLCLITWRESKNTVILV